MSKLEIVAIQFGVKVTDIYNLHYYVDRVCQRYLHFFIHFETLPFLQNISCFIEILFNFKVIIYYSLYGFTTLGEPFYLEGIMLHSYWLIRNDDGRRGRLPYLYPLEALKCLMSVNMEVLIKLM